MPNTDFRREKQDEHSSDTLVYNSYIITVNGVPVQTNELLNDFAYYVTQQDPAMWQGPFVIQ